MLGTPASANCVRHTADQAVVQGTLLLQPRAAAAVRALLAECGLPEKCLPAAAGGPAPGSSSLLIRREVRQLRPKVARQGAEGCWSRELEGYLGRGLRGGRAGGWPGGGGESQDSKGWLLI